MLSHNHFAFKRTLDKQTIIVAVNSNNATIDIELSDIFGGNILEDILNDREIFKVINGKVSFSISPNWGRILELK